MDTPIKLSHFQSKVCQADYDEKLKSKILVHARAVYSTKLSPEPCFDIVTTKQPDTSDALYAIHLIVYATSDSRTWKPLLSTLKKPSRIRGLYKLLEMLCLKLAYLMEIKTIEYHPETEEETEEADEADMDPFRDP